MVNGVEYKYVQSSNVRGVGYDETTGTLYVEFNSGAQYAYDNVPPDVYEDFLTAPSPGQYFNDTVKDIYAYRRV